MSNKFSLLLRGSGLRVLQTFVSIIIGLLMMPFLIASLGKEDYGLWIVISSIVTSYYLLDLGFNQAVTRYVSKFIHQKDFESANRVINTALVIYSGLGSILFFISVVIASLGVESLMDASGKIDVVQTVLIISALSIALEFPAKSFPGIISAYMRFDVIASVRFVKSIVDAICIYVAVSHGYGLVALASITFITGLLSTIIYVRYSTSLFKQLSFGVRYVDKATFSSIFHFSKWVFVFDISTTVRDKMDIWFISYYLGPTALPVYYVAVRLVEYAMQFMQQATNLSGPIFTEYYVKGDRAALSNSFSFFLKTNIWLGVTAFAGLYAVGYEFIVLWMKGIVSSSQAYLCLLIIASGRFMAYVTAPIQSMLMTINRHHIGAKLAVFESLLTLLLIWALIPKIGIIGAAIAVSVPYILGRVIFLPLLIKSHVDWRPFSIFAHTAVYAILSAALAFGIKSMLTSMAHNSIIYMFICGVLVFFGQILLSIFIFDSIERQKIIITFKNRMRRGT